VGGCGYLREAGGGEEALGCSGVGEVGEGVNVDQARV
jgi:hypothetical protein